MTLRAIGPFNGILPEATGQVVGFIRDPATFPYLRYTQLIPAPDIIFEYLTLDPDEPTRLVTLNEFVWAYDDFRPTGKGFTLRAEWTEGRTTRWDFPYTLGENTIRLWCKQGIDTRSLYDAVRGSQAALHRATRVVTAIANASWGANTASQTTVVGANSYWDKSSGGQYDPATGLDNPGFLSIKKALNRVKRRVHLATNGVVGRNDLYCVIPPAVAQAISESGEMFEALKQSRYAANLTDGPLPSIIEDWNLPPRYAGFNFVVEDTVRCFINQKDNGVVADVTVPSEKDYILNADTVFFTSRPGGLDGGYGKTNFSTIQVYHHKGEARVEAFSEPKHEIVEGHIVMEDVIKTPALISGFALTDVLS